MASRAIPAQMRQIMVKKLGNKFREVTEVVQVPVPKPGPKQALVRTSYVAINASDIMFTSGFYTPGAQPPFPAGLEAMGEIVLAGEGSKLNVGQNVVFSKYGSFSEYLVVNDANVAPVPTDDPVVLNLPISGTTASIALEKKGELKKGENVLVTAAAGATGQFVVQLAKLAGCHVIGTCSSEEKAAFLKSIGCDRTVNYNKESLSDVLTKEYPNGVDVVYESVGYEMFKTCFKNLSIFGRLIVIGAISGYESEEGAAATGSNVSIPFRALEKSADVRGFFLGHYKKEIPAHIARLFQLITTGQLKAVTDNGEKSDKGPFRGIDMVYDAVEYMYARKNTGKVVVKISTHSNSSL
ncbi:Zinc-binding alcohol dehydrogenase domain-containing protein 2-like [Plakobranchus ocellatus]|uniref:15-oxoprostaglandin 13-reductase n=1 Tax=Plakobranchus ocellatus TaxID=259542 RepID=A0AAV3Y1E7_9GAST|nr:Zinc-binding alcohol dehydrogenase domain-containing protein 2-like [Plakobranchus ocellatus]